MRKQLRISGKTLGKLALPGFCSRCFWLEMHANLPYQFFPGIFSSIDAYTKNVIHAYFDEYGKTPNWLSTLGNIIAYREPPHFSKFQIVLDQYGILLTGAADGIFLKDEGSYVIVDYKTAKFTAAQDVLLPMYEVQLNAYALIGEQTGFSPVSDLALIYMEPVTAGESLWGHCQGEGFGLDFHGNILKVSLNPRLLDPLLNLAKDIFDLSQPPQGNKKCKNCCLLNTILELVSP